MAKALIALRAFQQRVDDFRRSLHGFGSGLTSSEIVAVSSGS